MTRPNGTTPESWTQLSFLRPQVIELTLKVGIQPGDDHAQFQLEGKDATSGSTILISSRMHTSLADAPNELRDWHRRMQNLVDELSGPFPPG